LSSNQLTKNIMAKIYSTPSSIFIPRIDLFIDENGYNIEKHELAEKQYEANLREYLQEQVPNVKEVGYVLKFPTADSYAYYMVASLKPATLIHMPLGDAWQNQIAETLTATTIKRMIGN
jgi:hypothetical protein